MSKQARTSKRKRTTTTILLVAFVVLAGCVGGVGDASETTAKSTVESTDSTVNRTNAANGTAEPNEHPLADGSTNREHAAALKNAGSFTVRTNVTMRGSESDVLPFRNVTTYADVSSGELLTRERTLFTGSSSTYAAPDGTQYRRVEQSVGGSPEYRRPTVTRNASDYLDSAPGWFADAYDYSYEGTTTLDGERVHVYTVTTVDQWEDPSAAPGTYGPENVTDLDVRTHVTDAGLVKQFTFHVEREYDGERVTTDMRIEFTDIGTTEVEPPSWLDEAERAFEARTTTPDPSREVTETVRDESLGAAVTVEGPKYAVDRFALDSPSHWPFLEDDGEGFREAQVSAAVSVRASSDVELGTLELAYDGSAIPDADESDFEVYRYNETLQTFFAVETTVDAESDVARIELDREGTYLVMHTPTWREGWE